MTIMRSWLLVVLLTACSYDGGTGSGLAVTDGGRRDSAHVCLPLEGRFTVYFAALDTSIPPPEGCPAIPPREMNYTVETPYGMQVPSDCTVVEAYVPPTEAPCLHESAHSCPAGSTRAVLEEQSDGSFLGTSTTTMWRGMYACNYRVELVPVVAP